MLKGTQRSSAIFGSLRAHDPLHLDSARAQNGDCLDGHLFGQSLAITGAASA